MWNGIVYPSVFKSLFLSLILLIGLSTPIHSQEGATKQVETSLENLETLIKTLETPEQRGVLLKELKTLVELQRRQLREEAPQKERPNLIERFITEYGEVTRETSGFFHRLFYLVQGAPEGLKRTEAYLSVPENRATLYRVAAVIGVGIAAALIIIFLIRFFTSALLTRIMTKKRTTGGRVYQAAIMMIIRVSPYGALFIVAFLVLNLLRIRGLSYEFAILFLLTLLVYRAIYNFFRILLSPFDPEARVFQLADETSAYAWIWAKRFLNLWVLYYFVTESLEILGAPPLVFAGISKILILFFPILSTILLLQLKRMYAPKRIGRGRTGFWSTLLSYCARFWPLATGVIIWLISMFIIADYQEGIAFLIFASLKTAAALGILWGLLYVIDPLFNRLFSLGKEIKQRFPGLEEKTNRYIGTLKRVTKGVVLAITIGSVLEFWGLQASWFVTSELGSTILSRVIAIAIVIGVVLAVIDLSGFVTDQLVQSRTDNGGRIIEPGRKRKTLVPLLHWVVNVAAIFVGGVLVLNQSGVNVTPILAGAGIVGLAVGFGAQSLVKDFINGLFLLFEDSVAVGDVVIINGTGGLVEAVTLRTIKMRDLAGNVHVVPNGSVNMITNMTKEYSRYVFDVGVAYRENVDEVMAILKEIGESMQNDPEYKDDILEPLEILGVDKFDDSAVVIKARIATKPIKQWKVGREFNRRMKKIFDERGIEIPFPHRTMYWGEPKTGQAPPLAIQLSGQMTRRGEETA